jgi:biotin transport system ATP-binding protein
LPERLFAAYLSLNPRAQESKDSDEIQKSAKMNNDKNFLDRSQDIKSRDDPILEVTDLRHRFSDGALGIDGVSLSIHQGEFVVLAGPNGSGKTTLMRHFNGLLSPTHGTIKVAGRLVSDNPGRARRLVGMVFQDADSQIVGETVWEDTAFGPENLAMAAHEITETVGYALETVGLRNLSEKPPHLLSGGEKRRLAIAGVLAMQPPIIVFDEPFSSLDYPGTCQVLEQMTRMHQKGHTLIVATHDLEKVSSHAGRLIIMQNGKIVRDGLPNDIAREAEMFGVRVPCALRYGMEIDAWPC